MWLGLSSERGRLSHICEMFAEWQYGIQFQLGNKIALERSLVLARLAHTQCTNSIATNALHASHASQHTHNVQIQLQLMHFMRLLCVESPCSLQNISLHHQLATFPQTCLRVKFKLFGRVGGVKERTASPQDAQGCVCGESRSWKRKSNTRRGLLAS